DLVQKSVGPLDEKAEYDIEPEIEAMLPKGYEIQEITETNKQGTSGTIQQDLEFVIQVMKQQEQKKEPEVNLYTLSLRYINAVNEEDIATVPLKDQKENEEVDLKTIALAHLPEGYKIVELPKEESLVMKQDESVDIYIQPINEYYVRVNYLDEETNKSIHYANKIAGLVQGSDWDASRFDQIKINGYTHVKTEGQVKGDAIAQDVTINVYYKKDSKGSADTNKDDSKKDPTKVDAANTATKTNEGLYITIGFVALAAILLFAFKLKRSHKKD
ncbi:MucBP domain-containing protein, partial [Dubosiella newyorkensis]